MSEANEQLGSVIRSLKDDLDRVTAERDRLREALTSVEWGSWSTQNQGYQAMACPECGNLQGQGHRGDCLVKAALNPTEATR